MMISNYLFKVLKKHKNKKIFGVKFGRWYLKKGNYIKYKNKILKITEIQDLEELVFCKIIEDKREIIIKKEEIENLVIKSYEFNNEIPKKIYLEEINISNLK
jgi:hypothetical protein